MKKVIFTILTLSILMSCNDNNSIKKEDYDKLKTELDECKKTVEDLSNTPQMRLTIALKLREENNVEQAKSELRTLIEKFSGTDEAKKASQILKEIEESERKEKEEAEKKRLLGFKALKETSTTKVGEVSLKFTSINSVSQWNFDDYGSEYRLRKAERGNIYINAKVAISADNKDPNLPPISVYKAENGELRLLGTMGYEFVRWKDYGSYLGNYADYGNDFSHTKTISFSCGLQIAQNDLDNNAIFVVVKNQNCFYRSTDRFSNPPVKYKESGCNVKNKLTVEDFDSDYILLKLFNRNKL